jgi:hypothetical protein
MNNPRMCKCSTADRATDSLTSTEYALLHSGHWNCFRAYGICAPTSSSTQRRTKEKPDSQTSRSDWHFGHSNWKVAPVAADGRSCSATLYLAAMRRARLRTQMDERRPQERRQQWVFEQMNRTICNASSAVGMRAGRLAQATRTTAKCMHLRPMGCSDRHSCMNGANLFRWQQFSRARARNRRKRVYVGTNNKFCSIRGDQIEQQSKLLVDQSRRHEFATFYISS